MIVLVYDNQVAGIGDSLDNLPNGFSAYDVPSTALENLYFDGVTVLVKPDKPDPSAYWLGDAWCVPTPIETPQVNVYEPFSNSPLFQEAWVKAQTDIKTLAIFATALYADTKGDRELLEYAKTQLEDILTQP